MTSCTPPPHRLGKLSLATVLLGSSLMLVALIAGVLTLLVAGLLVVAAGGLGLAYNGILKEAAEHPLP